MTPDEIRDMIDDAMRVIRMHKEEMVKTAGADAEMAPRIEIFRGGRPVALLVIPAARETVASGIHAAITFFRGDVVVLTYDSWGSDTHENPDTGAPWSPTGMSEYVEKHGQNKAVHEAMHIHVISSAGNEGVAKLKYSTRISTVGTTEVLWGEPIVVLAGEISHDDGFYQEVAAWAFERRQESERMLDPVRAEYAHHTPEWIDGFIDASVCRSLEDYLDHPLGVLLMCSGDEEDRRRAIEKVFNRKMSTSPEGALQVDMNTKAAEWN